MTDAVVDQAQQLVLTLHSAIFVSDFTRIDIPATLSRDSFVIARLCRKQRRSEKNSERYRQRARGWRIGRDVPSILGRCITHP